MYKAYEEIFENLKKTNKLSALPIGPVDWKSMTIKSFDGRVFRAYGTDGTWVENKPLQDGDIRYLGSASHAGKIELKALYVLFDNEWHNILTGETSPFVVFRDPLSCGSISKDECS